MPDARRRPPASGAVARWVSAGWRLELRPIRPDDAALWEAFIRNLSPASRYKRGAVRPEELTEQLIRRKVMPDPDVEIALVAVAQRGGARELAGVGRLVRQEEGCGEFMLVVADAWQRRGIGRRLITALVEQAPRLGTREIEGLVLATNGGMLDFCRALGFAIGPSAEGPLFRRAVKAIIQR